MCIRDELNGSIHFRFLCRTHTRLPTTLALFFVIRTLHICQNVYRLSIYLFIKIKNAENMAHYHYPLLLIQRTFSKYWCYLNIRWIVWGGRGTRERKEFATKGTYNHSLNEIPTHSGTHSSTKNNNNTIVQRLWWMRRQKSMRPVNDFILYGSAGESKLI